MLSYINRCNKWYCPNNLEFTVYIIWRSVLSVTKNILTCLHQPGQLRQDNDMVDHTPKVPQSRREKNQPNHTLKNLAYICLKNMSHKATCTYSPSTPPPNHPLKIQQPQKHKKEERKKGWAIPKHDSYIQSNSMPCQLTYFNGDEAKST